MLNYSIRAKHLGTTFLFEKENSHVPVMKTTLFFDGKVISEDLKIKIMLPTVAEVTTNVLMT